MQTKLTLSLDKEVIEKAKKFSKRQHKSLSKLVENYLSQITHAKTDTDEITPLVAELSGLVTTERAKRRKEEYADYLAEKYK